MTAPYVPKVGDRVRHDAWAAMDTARVTAVGERKVLMVRGLLPEASWDLCNIWTKVEEPTLLPEGWANVYPSGVANTHNTRGKAEAAATPGRIALVRHLDRRRRCRPHRTGHSMIRSLIAITAVALLASGCSWRTTDQRIIDVGGEEFVCTYTLNNISGNESESVCTQIIKDGEP